jgi:hypothetical protein
MNTNEFNGAEFSGASTLGAVLKTARAVASAVVTGYKSIYRGASVVISSNSSVIARLRNQYNGLITFAAVVRHSVGVSGRLVRSKVIRAVLNASYSVAARLSAIRRVASVVSVAAVSIIGKLVDQFNGIVAVSLVVAHRTVITAAAIGIAKAKSVSSTYVTVVGKLNTTLKAKSIVTAGTTNISAFAAITRRIKALVTSSTLVIAKMSVVDLLKTIILHSTEIISKARRRLAGKSVVSNSTTIIANLKSTTNAPAGADNTFVVPPDDLNFDVEES